MTISRVDLVIIEIPSYLPIFELNISEIRMSDSYKKTGTIAFNLRIDSINIYDFLLEGNDKFIKRSIFGDLDAPKILAKNSREYLNLIGIENYSALYQFYKADFSENFEDQNLDGKEEKESSLKRRSNSLFDVSIMKNSLEKIFCYRLFVDAPGLVVSSMTESAEAVKSLFVEKCMYYYYESLTSHM